MPSAPVVAWLGRRDFLRARACGPAFSLWRDYREFVQERDALFVGYGTAGVAAQIQWVPFCAFERWMRLTGAPFDIVALDAFAAHWRWRAKRPQAPIAGDIFESAAPVDRDVHSNGVEIVPVRADLFARWRGAYAKIGVFETPPALDDYAALVVETCFRSSRQRHHA